MPDSLPPLVPSDPAMAVRRRTVHGVTVGILMVETYFRRWVGDIGNAETWPFPVQYRIVHGATPHHMTRLQGGALIEPFRQAAMELIEGGVDGIVTSCGFLALYQRDLAAALPVPVAASALLQGPLIAATLPAGKRLGVFTYDAAGLTLEHLQAAGLPGDTLVVGMDPSSQFCRSIRDGDATVPYEALEAEVLATAGQLAAEGVGAILCECTNLTPFSAAMQDRFGLPVWDAVSLVHWFHQGLRPRRFPAR